METIECKSYMQHPVDVSTKTYYDTIEAAHLAALNEYDGTETIVSVGASCQKRDGKSYYRIEFYESNDSIDWNNMAICAEHNKQEAQRYVKDIKLFFDMDEWAISSQN